MKRMCTVVVVLLSFGMWGQGVLAGPVDSQGRPLIRKLGTIDCDLVEATPIVFKGKLYRSEWVRTSYKGYEMRVVRSQNLIHWNPSSLNPVLKASPEDKQIANPKLTAEQRQHIAEAEDINNSDIDFCPYKGRLVISYSWGNQRGKEFLATAVYDGSLEEFLRSWFPNDDTEM